MLEPGNLSPAQRAWIRRFEREILKVQEVLVDAELYRRTFVAGFGETPTQESQALDYPISSGIPEVSTIGELLSMVQNKLPGYIEALRTDIASIKRDPSLPGAIKNSEDALSLVDARTVQIDALHTHFADGQATAKQFHGPERAFGKDWNTMRSEVRTELFGIS